MNQRISPRKPLKTRVIFLDEEKKEYVYFISNNISTSGIFLETPIQFKEGTKVLLKFQLTENTKPIITSAEIKRQFTKRRGPGRQKPTTPGMGLRFLSLSSDDFKRIEEFLSF